MYTLYNGDCLEVMKTFPDKEVDMVLCDLPYGVSDCKWDKIIPLDKLWEQYNRITKDNGAIVLFSVQPFTTRLIQSNIRNYRYNWYWKKNSCTGALSSKFQPMRCMEDICVFYKRQAKYRPQGLIRLENAIEHKAHHSNLYKKKKNNSIQEYTNYPKNLLEFKKEFGLHPTQKPVPLLEYLIKTYTDNGETVLDNCMGSGSTGVASVNAGRKFIGIELEKKYYDIAEKRMDEAFKLVS